MLKSEEIRTMKYIIAVYTAIDLNPESNFLKTLSISIFENSIDFSNILAVRKISDDSKIGIPQNEAIGDILEETKRLIEEHKRLGISFEISETKKILISKQNIITFEGLEILGLSYKFLEGQIKKLIIPEYDVDGIDFFGGSA